MKLKFLSAALALCILLVLPVTAGETVSVEICYDDCVMPLTGYARAGVTYVPLRRFYELLGGSQVTWDGQSRSAAVSGRASVTFTLGQSNTLTNGVRQSLTGAPYASDGSMYVPLRGIAQALSCGIAYDAALRRVTLSPQTDADSLYWLARIIQAESGGESYAGKLAVGSVILNRVESAAFPDTVYGVIFDRNNGVQFTPVANGTVYNTPSEESLSAARACLSGTRTVADCLYFFNPATATKAGWIVQNCVYYASIGNHDFYRAAT